MRQPVRSTSGLAWRGQSAGAGDPTAELPTEVVRCAGCPALKLEVGSLAAPITGLQLDKVISFFEACLGKAGRVNCSTRIKTRRQEQPKLRPVTDFPVGFCYLVHTGARVCHVRVPRWATQGCLPAQITRLLEAESQGGTR